MLKYDQHLKSKDRKIDELKAKLTNSQDNFEDLETKYNTLAIEQLKIKEAYSTAKKDLQDTNNKLHITNRARHELEIKVGEL